MRALLDINVLIALLDAAHVNHSQAMNWLEGSAHYGWASCPLTQNGCIRIMSNPGYPDPLPPALVADRLGEAADHPEHRFWPDDINLLKGDIIDWTHILSNSQITYVYLLALAVHNQGRLIAFDRKIDLKAVSQAGKKHLLVLS